MLWLSQVFEGARKSIDIGATQISIQHLKLWYIAGIGNQPIAQISQGYLHFSNTMTGYFGTWFPYHFQFPFSLISLLPVIKTASKYLSLNQTSILASSPSGSNLVMMILASDV